ncbi:MAG TPA: transglycosylase SLT domain-containing protein [Myxococcota bacterium]
MNEPDLIRAAAGRASPRGVSLERPWWVTPRGIYHLWCGLGLALLLVGLASPALAGGPILSFTDENGVVHFTNVPHGDTRYRPLPRSPQRPQRVHAAPARYDYDPLIGQAAEEHRLPPALVKAVIAAESDFDPQAVSRAGAQGLMQLMPTTAAHLGVADPLEPRQNVHGGVSYLRSLLDRYGDLTRALAAYNAGPEAVDRYGGIPPYRETRAYVDRVLTYYRHYHGDFAR